MRAPDVQLRIPSRGSNSVGLPHWGFYPSMCSLGGGAWVGQGPGQGDLGGSQQGRWRRGSGGGGHEKREPRFLVPPEGPTTLSETPEAASAPRLLIDSAA